MNNRILLGLGNVYVETNFLGIESGGKDDLKLGNEYSAPKYEVRLGGSAVNFITQSKRLGMDVGLIGKCGNDKPADTLFEMLKNEGIRTDFIKKSIEHQTNIDTGVIFAHNAQNIQIVAGSANQSLALNDIDFESKIFNSVAAVYFGGSFKQKLLWPHYPYIFEKLSKRNIKLFIDPGRVPVDADKKWVDVLKKILPFTSVYFPNDKELLSVSGKENIDDGLKVVKAWGAQNTIVKLGPGGCVVSNNKKTVKVDGFKVKAINTVGAGDCFNASFIYKYLDNNEIEESAVFANASAAFRVSKNFQPNLNEVENFMNEYK